MDIRENAEKLAAEYIEKNRPCDWFEALYAEADGDNEHIPWADLVPNRFLVRWAETAGLKGDRRSALVIGCGLGDDAAYLNDLGFRVTAFDVSPKAIEWARSIHADSAIDFHVADLFSAPAEWQKAFDFVLEVYTIQALPLDLREKTIAAIGKFIVPGGKLIIVTRGREDDQPADKLPWALSRKDLSQFERIGFTLAALTEMPGDEEDPITRFVVEYDKGP